MRRAVLHVAQPGDAGVARWIVDHSARQLEAGWSVDVACPPDTWLDATLRAAGIPVHAWPARREPHRGVLGEVRRLRGVLARTRPALVHLHSSKAGLVGRLALRGSRPTVFSPHAWSFDAVDGPVARAALAWERAGARWADRVLCVSAAERELGIASGIRATWSVVPNGIDLRRHAAAGAAERAAARAQLGLAVDAPLLVCLGRLSRQKGQDLLLDAWPRVRDRVVGAQLVLVGDGPERAALAARTDAGAVLAGPTDDPVAWFAAADVVVVPSRWEGMAYVPLEAMAAARAVVGFDVTGMHESVPADAGALVPAGDVAALAGALAARLADRNRADAEGAAGRRHVEREHDVAVLSQRVLDVYVEVLTAGGASSTSPSSR